MSYDFAVTVNGWQRDVFYTDKGEYVSFGMPWAAFLSPKCSASAVFQSRPRKCLGLRRLSICLLPAHSAAQESRTPCLQDG